MLTPLKMMSAPILLNKRANADPDNPTPITQKRTQQNSHLIYSFDEPTCRVKQTKLEKKQPQHKHDRSEIGMYGLTMVPDGTGETFWLPYGWNEIHSVKLPANPRNGITTVITANLSGCCIFIERKRITNDVIFYHANSVQNSPAPLISATEPTEQTSGALKHLLQLFQTASVYYPGDVVQTVTLPKAQYNAKIDDILLPARSSKEHKKKVVSFAAGTTVVAFFVKGNWEFWYQTYARVEHYYVDQMCKQAKESQKTYREFQVVDCRQFYP